MIIEDSLENSKKTIIEMEMFAEFLEKQRYKIKQLVGEKAIDVQYPFTIKSKIIFTCLLTKSLSLKWRFEKWPFYIMTEFLCRSQLSPMDFNKIKKWTNNISIKYD